MQYAFQDERQARTGAEGADVVPGSGGVGVQLRPVADGRGRVALGRRREGSAKDGIGEVIGEAFGAKERQEGALQVAIAPAHQARIEGDDDGGVARGFGAADQAGVELRDSRWVELEPERATGFDDLLDGARRDGAEDERYADRGGSFCGGKLTFGVDDGLNSDGA